VRLLGEPSVEVDGQPVGAPMSPRIPARRSRPTTFAGGSRHPLAQAVESYPGDLLLGVDDDCAVADGERVRRAHIGRLEALIELDAAEDDVAAAVLRADRTPVMTPSARSRRR
jgi:hypothetical protein